MKIRTGSVCEDLEDIGFMLNRASIGAMQKGSIERALVRDMIYTGE